MNNLSNYITILCGVFKDKYTPLTRAAFWKLYHKYNDSVEALIESDEKIVKELLKRSASVTFAISDMLQTGIHITTFLDEDFPKKLYSKLGDFCPPLLYSCGNSDINRLKCVGYVGSRNINVEDVNWSEARVADNLKNGFTIATGGAKGIDTTALNYALNNGGKAVVFLPNNIEARVREAYIRQNILENKLLVYSHISPYAPKSKYSFVAAAMERNKFIYAQSVATVVVRSDLNKGGTWADATEALKYNLSYVYAWDNKSYEGNQELIRLGAKGLSDAGNTNSSDSDRNAVKARTSKHVTKKNAM